MTGDLLRVVAAIIVLAVPFLVALAYASPMLPDPPLLQIGVAHIVDLMAEGCGHWSNPRD